MPATSPRSPISRSCTNEAISESEPDLSEPDGDCTWPAGTGCAGNRPSCAQRIFAPRCGKPFPLGSDHPADPAESDQGIERAPDGTLRLIGTGPGTWSYLLAGCIGCESNSAAGDTDWVRLDWKAEVPPGAVLTLRARAGKTASPDRTWGPWSQFATSPADLAALAVPKQWEDGYLQVEVLLSAPASTPLRLIAIRVVHDCPYCPG